MEHPRGWCAQYRLTRHLTAALVALSCAACATPLVPAPRSAPSFADKNVASQRAVPEMSRQTIGVAFGGGSARGIAHVGVIRWFEEHRIPIDVAAGTSMGGLVGGGGCRRHECG